MSAPEDASGWLAVDKPAGWTSHDVVAVLRGTLGTRRVGHGGTLDPLATGVLVVLAGTATKEAARLHVAPKAYAAIVRFGAERATDDAEGAVTREAAPPGLAADALERLLEGFRGTTSQVPPDYAAVKVGGRTAYARARAGETVVLAAREVTIMRLAAASWQPPDLRLLVVCTGGTYVRSLARDLGRAAGSAAHLGGLRRLAVGGITVDDAKPLDALRSGGTQAARAALRPLRTADLELPRRFLEEDADRILRDGEEHGR